MGRKLNFHGHDGPSTYSLFGPAFKVIKGILPTRVAKLIEVVPAKDLTKYIAKDQVRNGTQ